MKTRWMGVVTIGLLAVVLGLALTTVALAQGPLGRPGAGGMMGGWGQGGMMGSGGIMGGWGSGGMVGTPRGTTDASQPYDLRFLDEMIAHHAMGVRMTQHMVEDSARPEMRDLAQRIISAQQREITQMQAWRQEWYPNAPRSTGMGLGMMGGMMGSGMMGGMMQGAMRQMHPNADLDLMFLQMMIPHHEDAISMANTALQQGQHQEIQTLAQAIVTTQMAEIEEMRGYLKAWYGIQ